MMAGVWHMGAMPGGAADRGRLTLKRGLIREIELFPAAPMGVRCGHRKRGAEMRPEDTDAIRQLPLFRQARKETFAKMMRAGLLQRFPPGVTIINESDHADFLHVVVDGLVEMFATDGERETTLSLVRPVGTFILAAVLTDQVYLQSARTLRKSRLLMIPAGQVRAAMGADDGFTRAIVTHLALDYRCTVKGLKNQKLRTGAERLANWLIQNASHLEGGSAIELDFEKKKLSALLGMTPENLSRALSVLKPLGVSTAGYAIRIDDMAELRQFARPTPLIDGTE